MKEGSSMARYLDLRISISRDIIASRRVVLRKMPEAEERAGASSLRPFNPRIAVVAHIRMIK